MTVYVYCLRHIAFLLGHLPLWRGLVINFGNRQTNLNIELYLVA
jgi:hypothetical protein